MVRITFGDSAMLSRALSLIAIMDIRESDPMYPGEARRDLCLRPVFSLQLGQQ